MKKTIKQGLMLSCTALALVFTGCSEGTAESEKQGLSQTELGEQLFSDTSLSLNRTMSCASCHDMGQAMIDSRDTLGGSLGDDGHTFGDRSAPTAAYASFAPRFHFDSHEGVFVGGQFLDGRSKDLTEQAKGPFLNPVEMMMPDEASVIERVKENPEYVSEFKRLYGENIFDDTATAYEALAETIAKFEKSGTFASFDSKYDKALAGEETLSEAEIRGLALFNSKAECHACHPGDGKKALFTDYTFDNLGVPVNHALRDVNGKGSDFVDNGLYDNPLVKDKTLKGAFKVSTLRNIAVTGPYMHNGVFKELETVVHFYNTRDVKGAINPETGSAWEKGEVEVNKNFAELGNLKLSAAEEADLVAFLRTLTDERFEHLNP